MSSHVWRKTLVSGWPYVVVLTVLLAVFTLYTRPDFLVTLSNMLWACF